MKGKTNFIRFVLCLLASFTVLLGMVNAAEPIRIKILQYAPEMTEAMHDMAREYHKQFPNVSLEFTILQTDYIPVLKARLNSGDVPDVFMTGAYNENYVYKDYWYDLTNEPFMKNVEPAALRGVTYNGKISGFPLIIQAYSFIYNKKVFVEAGITKLPLPLMNMKRLPRS